MTGRRKISPYKIVRLEGFHQRHAMACHPLAVPSELAPNLYLHFAAMEEKSNEQTITKKVATSLVPLSSPCSQAYK
jgi:hypothetical protein